MTPRERFDYEFNYYLLKKIEAFWHKRGRTKLRIVVSRTIIPDLETRRELKHSSLFTLVSNMVNGMPPK